MSLFKVINHKIPCQYVREYPQALSNSQEDSLYLAVKQYIPKNNPSPQPGDVTIIGAHANGFPKELYEPLWDDLLAYAEKNQWRIRSVWFADVAHQGDSSILNEQMMGNDPSWLDHSRDLLNVINMKRAEMPLPLVGIGHSMGGAQLVNLAYMHPRLFTTLILIDPVIQERTAEIDVKSPKASLARLSTFRRDTWPSRAVAAELFNKSPFYRSWDKRVLEKWIDHGLRNGPTLLYPDATYGQVTLKTPASQEVHTFLRPNYEGAGSNGKPVNRQTHPDVNPSLQITYPFYRPESPMIFNRLPELRPSALYLFGELSDTSKPAWNEEKLTRTGSGVGGSGGRQEGRVKGVTFEGIGHLIAMEVPTRTAEEIGSWVGMEMRRWRTQQRKWEEEWKARTLVEKQQIDERWKKEVGGPLDRKKKDSKI